MVVAGFFDGSPAPQAYMRSTVLEQLIGSARRRSVMVASEVSGLPSRVDLIARSRAALANAGMPVASSQLLEESRRVTEDHLLMVVQFLGAMGWVMILVGGMGLASTMGLSVLERTREIAVMRAIGASHGALFGLVQAEGAVIAVLGWLVAVPLSIPFSLMLGEAFGRIMFRVPTNYLPHAPSVGSWLLIALAVSAVACAWPAWRAMRQPVAGALLLDA
jgi:putative ABC transport system permease protein